MSIVGIVTGLAFESAVLEKAFARLPLEQRPLLRCGGMGRDAARRATEELLEGGVSALMSFGIAAGLDSSLGPGRAIIATEIRGEGLPALACDPNWSADAARVLTITAPAPLAHAPAILGTAADKAALAGATGAVAADMESYGVGEAATNAGIPFIALRAIADGAGDAVPPVALHATDALGRVRITAAIWGTLTHPSQIPDLVRLGARTAAARRTLAELAAACTGPGFFV